MSFWHPFADMAAVSQSELLIERGEGVWVFDADDNRYFDATASLWYANIGHGREQVADAVAAQLRKLEAYHTFGDFTNRPANEVCERLARLAPVDDAKVFLTSGGGDSIEVAAKLARRHFVNLGQPERVHLISRTHGYHGTHGFGTSLGGIEPNVTNWGPLIPQTSVVPYDSLEALEAKILEVGPDKVAAFFCEPVIGAGGVRLPPEGYIQGVADLCTEHGILLVIDSVICAFGRLGTWFGVERWPDVRPDMITFAKGVTSGYIPLGGVVVSGAIAEPYYTPGGAPMFRHGATYAGHPAACAAALAVLDIYEAEGLIARGRELEGPLADGVQLPRGPSGRGRGAGRLGLPRRDRVASGSRRRGARRVWSPERASRASWRAPSSAVSPCPRRSRPSRSTSTCSSRGCAPDSTACSADVIPTSAVVIS